MFSDKKFYRLRLKGTDLYVNTDLEDYYQGWAVIPTIDRIGFVFQSNNIEDSRLTLPDSAVIDVYTEDLKQIEELYIVNKLDFNNYIEINESNTYFEEVDINQLDFYLQPFMKQ